MDEVVVEQQRHPSSLDTVTDNWQKQEPSSCMYPYTKTPGPTLPIPAGTTELDLFYRSFTPEVWSLLVIETIGMLQLTLLTLLTSLMLVNGGM